MVAVIRNQVESVLRKYKDFYTDKNLDSLNILRSAFLREKTLVIEFCFPYPIKGLVQKIIDLLEPDLKNLTGALDISFKITHEIKRVPAREGTEAIPDVKQVICIASGKGGVGKSTVTANLALALSLEGARVGLLDADIYGPSQAMIFGVQGQRPGTQDGKTFIPIRAHGLDLMSMAFLLTEKTPTIWRGPMVSSAFSQMLKQTKWDNLDYLLIDLPPGTGDIQLTLSQKVPVNGSIIVTTPQDIALLDARRGIEMFKKVNVPVLGILENMSFHKCLKCGEISHVFGQSGGERIVSEYDSVLLGSLPLDPKICEDTDNGKPVVFSNPNGDSAFRFRDISRRVGALLSISAASAAGSGLIASK